MKKSSPPDPELGEDYHRRGPWLLGIGCVLFVLIALLASRQHENPSERVASPNVSGHGVTVLHYRDSARSRLTQSRSGSELEARTPEEIVINKVSLFARNRREVVNAMARKFKLEVPDEVERFFDAVEAGRWDEIEELAQVLREDLSSADLIKLWPPAHEVWGAIQEAGKWPAQKLLDYGNTILSSLHPGMIYVGGTDPGRWIPTLLNETSASERHIVLTQNALADNTYLDYVNFLYGDRLSTLTADDSTRAFQDYMTDAQARLQHDQEFPDEPKQIRPGEDVRNIDGKIQVSGQVTVMSINEQLFQTLMSKNPDASFGLQESFPFKSIYADAAPLGPIMELRAPDRQNAFTPERAAQSLDYWRATTQKLLSDAEASASPATLMTHSHDAGAAANLLAAHNYSVEAEQAYRLSSQLWPGNPEPIGGLSEILARTGRADEADQLLVDFASKHPDQRAAAETIRASWDSDTPKSPSPRRP